MQNLRALESESEVAQSCPTLCDPMDSSLHQAPPSMRFSRVEYWSGLPFHLGYPKMKLNWTFLSKETGSSISGEVSKAI